MQKSMEALSIKKDIKQEPFDEGGILYSTNVTTKLGATSSTTNPTVKQETMHNVGRIPSNDRRDILGGLFNLVTRAEPTAESNDVCNTNDNSNRAVSRSPPRCMREGRNGDKHGASDIWWQGY
jgi:hypothetical protein